MPTIDVYDHDLEKRYFTSRSTASVGATGATEITTVDIPDGYVVRLVRAEADFSGTTLLSNDRGMILREEVGGTNTELVSVSTDGTFTPVTESLVYHNDNGETATLALRGFHGDTTGHDMFGHQTYREINQKG